MKRRPIHRGGIASAGYDRTRRWLDVEFETGRVLRCESIGAEANPPRATSRSASGR